MEEQKKIATYRLDDISLVKFSYENLPNKVYQIPLRHEYAMNVTARVDNEHKSVYILIHYEILVFMENGEKVPCGSADVAFSYHIVNFDDFIETVGDEKKASFSKLVWINFISVAISTSRGILWAKTQGTHMANGFLPVINPKDLVEKIEFINQ